MLLSSCDYFLCSHEPHELSGLTLRRWGQLCTRRWEREEWHPVFQPIEKPHGVLSSTVVLSHDFLWETQPRAPLERAPSRAE